MRFRMPAINVTTKFADIEIALARRDSRRHRSSKLCFGLAAESLTTTRQIEPQRLFSVFAAHPQVAVVSFPAPVIGIPETWLILSEVRRAYDGASY
jgi:hypothetical protein